MAIYDAGARLSQVGANVGARMVDNENRRTEVQAANAKFKLEKNRAEAANTPENITAEVEALRAANRQLAANQAKTASYDAFKRYTSDFNPRHLNDLMRAEPLVREAFGNPVSFERVNPETDGALINQFNLRAGEADAGPGGPSESANSRQQFDPRSHLKVIDANGNARIQDIRMDMAGAGYFQYLDDQELDRLIKESKLFGDGDGDKKYAPGSLEKDADYLARQGIEGGDQTKIADNLYKDRIGGNAVYQQQQADMAVEGVFNQFGGEDEYFNTDFSVTKNRVSAERYIRRLEKYGGVDIPAADRADYKEIATLIKTGSIAANKLTPEVTGAFDSVYRNVKNYVVDNVDEVDQIVAQSAYASFRNTMRHALFGSALTDTEISSFNEAFGTIKEKYPAVVKQFVTALEQTKSKIESIYSLNNPILTKYYFNKSAEDVAIIIRELDNRIEMFKRTKGEKVTTDPENPASVSSKTIDDIMNDAFGPVPGADQ